MDFTFTTPALLFPAISLLLLAYTNRFLAIATLIRQLIDRHRSAPSPNVRHQIDNLRRRVRMIRSMQISGVAAFFLCVLCMLVLFAGQVGLGRWVFGASLVLLLVSLFTSLLELSVSVSALELQLGELDDPPGGP